MGGYSIFGSCLDGIDCCVRLDQFMAEEHGGKGGWIVKECCLNGYLLISNCYSYDDKIAPELSYSIESARERMLNHLAEVGKLDPDQLSADYAAGNCHVMAKDYHADKKSACLTTGYDSWEWEIKPAFIYSPLRIEFGCECA